MNKEINYILKEPAGPKLLTSTYWRPYAAMQLILIADIFLAFSALEFTTCKEDILVIIKNIIASLCIYFYLNMMETN